jgi:hypothetical protein
MEDKMCCQPGTSQKMHKARGAHPDNCQCGCDSFPRRFYSSKEEQSKLEEYRDQLRQELAGVEEYIGALKKK